MGKLKIFQTTAHDSIDDPISSDPSKKKVKLSIVIVNYNTPQLTLECLESIFVHPPHVEFEVILVDNGSDDNLESTLSQSFPKVRFLEMGENTGFARANNLGIFNSHGQYVLLLNSDTKIIDSLFDSLICEMEDHPQLGCVGPLHVDGDERYQLSFGKFPTLRTELLRKLLHYRISIDDPLIRDYLGELSATSKETDWVSGSCILIRRKALVDSGLLDESFFMYFEDVDLCTRIRKKNWEIRYSPLAKLVHYGGQSVKGNLLQGLVEYRRSQLYFTRKYYGRIGSIVIRSLLFAKYGFSFCKWALFYLKARFFGQNRKRHYVMLLLAKKVIEMVFSRTRLKPLEPKLRPIHQKSQVSS